LKLARIPSLSCRPVRLPFFPHATGFTELLSCGLPVFTFSCMGSCALLTRRSAHPEGPSRSRFAFPPPSMLLTLLVSAFLARPPGKLQSSPSPSFTSRFCLCSPPSPFASLFLASTCGAVFLIFCLVIRSSSHTSNPASFRPPDFSPELTFGYPMRVFSSASFGVFCEDASFSCS